VLRSVVVRSGDMAHYAKQEPSTSNGAVSGSANVGAAVQETAPPIAAPSSRHLDVTVEAGLRRAASLPAAQSAIGWMAGPAADGANDVGAEAVGTGGIPPVGRALPGLRFSAQPRSVSGLGRIE